MITITTISTDNPLYEEERALRNRVLLRPFGLPDYAWEMKDGIARHFVALDEDRVVGCLLLVPLETSPNRYQLMQMAVDFDYQKKGVGKALIHFMLQFCQDRGIQEVHCHSRETANAFYQKLGFEIYGAPFAEVGIAHNYIRYCFTP